VIFPVCILVFSYTDRLKIALSILAQKRNKRNHKRKTVAESSQFVTKLQQSGLVRSSYSVFKILKFFKAQKTKQFQSFMQLFGHCLSGYAVCYGVCFDCFVVSIIETDQDFKFIRMQIFEFQKCLPHGKQLYILPIRRNVKIIMICDASSSFTSVGIFLMTDQLPNLLVYCIQRFEVSVWSVDIIISESIDRLVNLL